MSLKIADSPEEEKEKPEAQPEMDEMSSSVASPPGDSPPMDSPPPAAPPSDSLSSDSPPESAPPSGGGGDGGGDDGEGPSSSMPEMVKHESKLTIIYEAIAPKLQQYRKQLIISGGILAVLIGLVIGWYNLLYPAMLLKSGEDFMSDGEYQQARGYITAYHNTGKSDDSSKLLLARAFLFGGDPVGARDAIGVPSPDSPELQYIHALGGFAENPKETAVQLDVIRFEGEAPPYVSAARGVLSMLGGNNAAAAAAFAQIRDIETEPDDLTERHLRALFNILLNNLQLHINTEASLLFTLPKVQGKIASSRVTSGPEGFERIFNVPFNTAVLNYDMRETSVRDFIRGLELLADTQNTPENADEVIESKVQATGSLLAQFIVGYYHIKAERFLEAADVYGNIANTDMSNPLARQYEGTAFWLSQKGELPDQRVLAAYNQALQINPENSTALNNLAFSYLNLGELEQAEELINRAIAVDNVNPHIVFNVLVIGIVNDTLDFEHALTRIESLVNRWSDSIVILELAAEVSILSQLSNSAIAYLEQIMESSPSAKHAIRIADLYRHSGQFMVAVAELKQAHELFPHNTELTELMALYYAKSGDYKTAASTLQQYGLPAGGQLGLYIRAIATDDAEAGEEAFALAAPAQKTGIGIELTRIHIRNGESELALKTLERARNNADASNDVDLDTSLEALKYRLLTEEDVSNEIKGQIDKLASQAGKSENATALLDLVWAYYNTKSYQAGIDLLTIIRRQPARLPLLRKALIIGHEQLGNDEVVARIKGEVYDEIVAAESGLSFDKYESRLSLLKAINSAVRGQEYELALGLYEGLTKGKFFNPKKAAVDHQNRGALHLVLRNFENAVADFKKGLELAVDDKQRETIHYNYVQALVQAKDYGNAEKEIAGVIQNVSADFKHLRVYERLQAGVLFFQAKYDQSRAAYRALITKYPRDVANYIGIATIELRQENYQKAVDILIDGLDIAPNSVNIHRLIQNAYHRMGRVDEAERHKKIIQNIRQ